MPSTRHPTLSRLRERLHHGPKRRPWRERVRRATGVNVCLRVLVFLAGLVLVLAGAALWLFSGLLTAPLVLAGLWVWSWEFAWARRLQHRFRLHVQALWKRVRHRPARWTLATVSSVAVGAAGYWSFMAYGPI